MCCKAVHRALESEHQVHIQGSSLTSCVTLAKWMTCLGSVSSSKLWHLVHSVVVRSRWDKVCQTPSPVPRCWGGFLYSLSDSSLPPCSKPCSACPFHPEGPPFLNSALQNSLLLARVVFTAYAENPFLTLPFLPPSWKSRRYLELV